MSPKNINRVYVIARNENLKRITATFMQLKVYNVIGAVRTYLYLYLYQPKPPSAEAVYIRPNTQS